MPDFTPLVTAQTITASGQSATQTITAGKLLTISARIERLAGTSPTLDLSVQWSNDGTDWTTLAADPLPQAGAYAIKGIKDTFTAKGSKWRLKWAIAGTSASFKVSTSFLVTTPTGSGGPDGDVEGKAYTDTLVGPIQSELSGRLSTPTLSATIAAQIAAAGVGGGTPIGIDTDGVPYYSTTGVSGGTSVQVDTDGVPYFA